LVARLIPGQRYHRAPPNAETRILSDDAEQVRHGIEIAASLGLAAVASEGVCRPLADLRMLVIEAFEHQAPGLGICLMVEKAEAVASNAPIPTAQTRPDHRQGSLPEADELCERLPTAAVLDRSQKAIDFGRFHRLGSFGAA